MPALLEPASGQKGHDIVLIEGLLLSHHIGDHALGDPLNPAIDYLDALQAARLDAGQAGLIVIASEVLPELGRYLVGAWREEQIVSHYQVLPLSG